MAASGVSSVTFYHFTSGPHLRAIAKHGLTVGDVPTDLARERGVIGVWLTSSDRPDGHGLEGSIVDKAAYRLTVAINSQSPVLHRWTDWAVRNVTSETIESLHKAAARNGSSEPRNWFVYFGVIAPSDILECVRMETGDKIADWANVSPPEFDVKPVPPSRRKAWQKRMLKDVRAARRSNGYPPSGTTTV